MRINIANLLTGSIALMAANSQSDAKMLKVVKRTAPNENSASPGYVSGPKVPTRNVEDSYKNGSPQSSTPAPGPIPIQTGGPYMPGGGGPGPAPIVGGLPNIPVGVGSLPFPSIVESTHRGGEAPHQLRNVGRKDNQYSGPGGQFGQVNYGSAPPNLGGISGIVPNLGGIGGSVPNLGGMGGIIGNSGHTVSASGRGVVGGGVRGGYGGSGGHGGHGSYGGQGGSGVLVGGGGGGGGGLLGSLPIPNVGGAMPYSSRSVTTGRETNGGGILGPLPIPNVGSLNPASIMSGIPQLPNMQGGGGSGGGINIRQPGNGYQIQGPSGYKFNGGRAGTGPFRISNGNNYQYSGHKSGSVEGYF